MNGEVQLTYERMKRLEALLKRWVDEVGVSITEDKVAMELEAKTRSILADPYRCRDW